MQSPIYLDNAATTRVDDRVIAAMLPYFTTYYGNASSSIHILGWQADNAVNVARKIIADAIEVGPEEIVFTSGATEACNLALRGVFEAYKTVGNHIITAKTEHSAVIDTCAALEKKGATVTYLSVNEMGQIDLDELQSSISDKTILIALMYGNNETGVMLPIQAIGQIAKKAKVLFFCDATQAFGKIPISVRQGNIDIMAVSGHKIHGPKGVGALYVRRKNPRVTLISQMTGGHQERNMRSGTLNVPGIVGFAEAVKICHEEIQGNHNLLQMRNYLEAGLLKLTGANLNGDQDNRLPHIVNLSFENVSSSRLLAAVKGSLAISSGAACASSSLEGSRVIKAMGLSIKRAKSAIRYSIGRFNTMQEIEVAINETRHAIKEIRGF